MKQHHHLFSPGDGHAGRQRRKERLLDASDVRLLILDRLSLRSAHGYELIKMIEAISGGEYSPSPGLIYPNLTLLEEMGHIVVADQQAEKKAWQLTEAGRILLADQQPALLAVKKRLEMLAVLVANRAIPAVEQAIHHMKQALHTQLSQADLPQSTLDNIITVLEKAAKEIAAS